MMISRNNEKFIGTAIESVLRQTYANWELTIVDDASTDGNWGVAKQYSDKEPRIRLYRNKTTLGTPKNRVEAAKHITGDLVGHLDSDDTLYPHSLGMMVSVFQNNPDISLAYSDMADIDANGLVARYHANPNPNGNLSNMGWFAFGVYRKEAYEKTSGYNGALSRGCEDGDLFMQIAEKGKVMRVPNVLYARRIHAENTSTQNYKCASCPDRPVCNYVKIWSKHAGYDPVTFTKIETAALS